MLDSNDSEKVLQEFWRRSGRWGFQHWKIHRPDLRIHAQHTAEAHLLSVIATVLLQHLLGDQLRCRALEKSTSPGALRIFESLFERIESSKRTGSRNLTQWGPYTLLRVFLVPHACAQVIKFHKLEKVCIVSDDSTYNPSFLVRLSNLPVAS